MVEGGGRPGIAKRNNEQVVYDLFMVVGFDEGGLGQEYHERAINDSFMVVEGQEYHERVINDSFMVVDGERVAVGFDKGGGRWWKARNRKKKQ